MDLTIESSEKREVIDITSKIAKLLKKSTKNDAKICNIVVLHTTCSLTTADLDPGGTNLDYLDFFDAMTPKLEYRHPHDPGHVPDHILASIVGPSVSLAVSGGKLQLGTWQRVVLIEFDGPRQRRLVVSCT